MAQVTFSITTEIDIADTEAAKAVEEYIGGQVATVIAPGIVALPVNVGTITATCEADFGPIVLHTL